MKTFRALTREGDIYGTPLTLAHSRNLKKENKRKKRAGIDCGKNVEKPARRRNRNEWNSNNTKKTSNS